MYCTYVKIINTAVAHYRVHLVKYEIDQFYPGIAFENNRTKQYYTFQEIEMVFFFNCHIT